MTARSRDSGQAAVETALTLPLFLFMILGTLQLFLLLQARLMAEHAVFTATRTGSLASGKCARMKHAALLTLLPTFTRTDDPVSVAGAFASRAVNRYRPALDWNHDGEIVWLFRDVPGASGLEDDGFDDPDRRPQLTLETRLVFWYPMRIPFANWVIARSVLAAWGGPRWANVNPLSPTRSADWKELNRPATVETAIFDEFNARTGAPAGTYVFPIQATAAMRMLTSPRLDADFIFSGPCK